jgi:adenylate cyclase class 2
MLEVEMKFTDVDHHELEARLAAWGATPGETVDEVDHYFNAPDRDFAKTDEALRVRSIGSVNLVTYKGPKKDPETKTRTEIEVLMGAGFEEAGSFMSLLVHLGYRPTANVRKRRRLYHARRSDFDLEICLDDVEELGQFAEVEIRAPEEQLDAARSTLMAVARELGLTMSERRSYLELLLRKRERNRS